MSSIGGISSSYLQAVVGAALHGTGLSTKTGQKASQASASQTGPTDQSQLSPFAQLMSSLQQLQQSDPAKYQQVTQQVATNLQGAAQTAQANGNTTAANTLNQLAGDFTDASKSGQIPNVKDLAQAMRGHHHHHHAPAGDPGATGASSSAAQTPGMSQLLAALQANSPQNDALNPMTIISNTLASAGLGSSQ